MNAEMILEAVFTASQIRYQKEFRFYPGRKWRFDYYLPDLKTGIEIEGGVFTGGRHTRGAGYAKDCEKYNAACTEGFKLLRYPAHEIVKTNGLRVYADIQKIQEAGE